MSFNLPVPQAPEALSLLIPEIAHPHIVHFAVALPAVIVVFEFVNLASRRRLVGIFSFFFMIVLGAVLYVSLLSGDMDAARVHSILGNEVKDLLGNHRTMGIYLFYGTLVFAIMKLISLMLQKTVFKLFVFTIALALAFITVTVGADGEKLVYVHGVNVVSAGSSSAVGSFGSTKMSSPAVSETEKKEQSVSDKPTEKSPALNEDKDAEDDSPKAEENNVS